MSALMIPPPRRGRVRVGVKGSGLRDRSGFGQVGSGYPSPASIDITPTPGPPPSRGRGRNNVRSRLPPPSRGDGATSILVAQPPYASIAPGAAQSAGHPRQQTGGYDDEGHSLRHAECRYLA